MRGLVSGGLAGLCAGFAMTAVAEAAAAPLGAQTIAGVVAGDSHVAIYVTGLAVQIAVGGLAGIASWQAASNVAETPSAGTHRARSCGRLRSPCVSGQPAGTGCARRPVRTARFRSLCDDFRIPPCRAYVRVARRKHGEAGLPSSVRGLGDPRACRSTRPAISVRQRRVPAGRIRSPAPPQAALQRRSPPTRSSTSSPRTRSTQSSMQRTGGWNSPDSSTTR